LREALLSPHFCTMQPSRFPAGAADADQVQMSKKPAQPAPDPQRLYLITPALAEAESFAPALEAALGAGDVACVLVRFSGPDEGTAKKIVRALLPIAQQHEAALLVEGDPKVAVRTDADGVHVRGQGDQLEEQLGEAIETLKPDRIVGAGGVKTRHDSMAVGELEIDYVMFGDPSPDGWTPLLEQVIERVSWWTEIFTVPCVGFAPRLEDVATISQAGADFVALGDAVWNDERGAAAAVAQAQAALARGAGL
jgi:thiamine-phosphate pyrophosphorylase